MTKMICLSVLLAACLAQAALAEDAPGEDLTRRLAEMIRQSERQVEAGKPEEALSTLAEAKQMALDAQRPEAGLVEARIMRLKTALEAPAAEPLAAPPAEGEEAKPADVAPAVPKGILLTLGECIEIAVQNNLSLQLSRLDDRASDIGLRTAWSRYYPTFSGSLTHRGGENDDERTNSTTFSNRVTQRSPWGTSATLSHSLSESFPHQDGNRSSSIGLDVRQPLWKGFGTDVGLHDIRTAKINKLISRGNLELDVQALIFDVRSAYANCIRLLQNKEVNERAVESARTFLRLTQARERAGQVTKLDVFNAEVQLADRELALTANIRQLETAFDRLKQIMDVDLEEQVAVVEEPVDFGEGAPAGTERVIETDEHSGSVTLVTRKDGKVDGEPVGMFQATRYDEQTILEEALRNRIELLNGRRNMALQKLNSLLAKDGLGHQVDLVAAYGRNGDGPHWSDAIKHKDNDFTLGLDYNIPWGKVSDRAAYERAILDLKRSEIDLKRVRTQVHLEVRNILRTLREVEKSTLIQGKKVEQAKRSVEAAQISFERGLKDSFDVIRAEDNLLAAKTDFINTRLDYVVRLAEIERVVGKATGRVDLDARNPGGIVESAAPEGPDAKEPRRAPTAEPAPEDDPFGYRNPKPAEEEKVEPPPARQ